MRILGIHNDHDAGVALIEDGRVLAAAAEERFARKKGFSGFPELSVKWILEEYPPETIDYIAVSGMSFRKGLLYFGRRYLKRALLSKFASLFGSVHIKEGKLIKARGLKAFLINILLIAGLPQMWVLYFNPMFRLKKLFRGCKGKVVFVDHHLCHALGAYYTSGFDNCLSLTSEGCDWENCVVVDDIAQGKIENIAASPTPHSPGYFYMLVTMILGFNPLQHAGKITGLAAYGDPRKELDKVKKLMWVEGMEVKVSGEVYRFMVDYLKEESLPRPFAESGKENIAAAFQQNLEDCLTEVIEKAVSETGRDKVLLSGGTMANVKLNQRIFFRGKFKDIFVHPAMGDDGQAVGAGLALYSMKSRSRRKNEKIENVYWGPSYSQERVEKALKEKGLEFEYHENIELEIAKAIESGSLVGRFAGKMEYGPRALGNRSILYHAADRNLNDWLNKVLNRTEFMPFAPCVLFEDRDSCFLNTEGTEYAAQFMTITMDCTDWFRQSCPAVVHVDGTARPQFVTKEGNRSLHKVIKEYKNLSGLPAIVNTSFNMHEEPIVCSPEDAVRAFLLSGIDYLAIENCMVKNPAKKSRQGRGE